MANIISEVKNVYSMGETFYYEMEDEEKQFHVVGDVVIKGKEYIVGEDNFNLYYVFWYDDMNEELIYIDDADEAEKLIDEWQEEYYGTIDEVGLWEEDYEEEDEEEDEFDEDDEVIDEEDENFGYYIDDSEDDEEDDDDYN